MQADISMKILYPNADSLIHFLFNSSGKGLELSDR